ncbi:MAG: AMP-dependent synthetase/ligase [Myxococcota bacterium]
MPPRLPASGQATFASVAALWKHRISSTPDLPAFLCQRDGRWEPMTWREADLQVTRLAKGLLALGLKAGDRIALLADTSTDWLLIDMAIQLAGGATTTLFPRSPDALVRHILEDSGATIVIGGTPEQALQLWEQRSLAVTHGVCLARHDQEEPIHGWHQLEQLASTIDDAELDARIAALRGDSLATLIYTSGTTGLAKGVRLSHDNWVYATESIDRLNQVHPLDVQLLFLPLAHVFAKVLGVAAISLGITTAVDGRIESLEELLTSVKPTWLGGVPRVFEKLEARIRSAARDSGWSRFQMFNWAVGVGKELGERRRSGRRVGRRLRLRHALADRVVFQPIRQALGGRLRFVISGAAPLPLETALFFDAIGITICEGYGLTESSAASCVNTPDDVVFGTVGRPLPGCELKIADDGEILLKSRGNMLGYHNAPDETARMFTQDGFLHTGDIGVLLPTGHLKITDRKKEMLITANGKNIAPLLVEETVRGACVLVEHCVVVGDGRHFLAALLTLDMDQTVRFAQDQNLVWTEPNTLYKHPAVHDAIQQQLRDANRTLAPWERVRRFIVLPHPLTIASGHLTPSMKVRRSRVAEDYASDITEIYEGARTSKTAS